MQINYGDHFEASLDDDGFPAVKAQNTAWVEDPRWITASSCSLDQEQNVRDLAAQLWRMADDMAAMRHAASA